VRYLRIKNWDEFQHYKDRNPPWIKLHRSLLDDYEFSRLQDASKAHLMLIWVFASQNNGRVPDDPKFLQTRLGLDKQPDLQSLVDQGFLLQEQDASNTLAQSEQGDSTVLDLARSREKRREEAEESMRRFGRFWSAYPRKVAKPDAVKAWKKLALSFEDFEAMMTALEAAKPRWTEPQYIPYPASWLNKERWKDEAPTMPATVKQVAM
jgi:hypothetical protein